MVAGAHEERFTRKRHDPDLPANAARYCLINGVDQLGFLLDNGAAIAEYERRRA